MAISIGEAARINAYTVGVVGYPLKAGQYKVKPFVVSLPNSRSMNGLPRLKLVAEKSYRFSIMQLLYNGRQLQTDIKF